MDHCIKQQREANIKRLFVNHNSVYDRQTQAFEPAASARIAGELSAVPTFIFWWIKYHMKDIDSSEMTIPHRVVSGL